jgi:hypothetical protein
MLYAIWQILWLWQSFWPTDGIAPVPKGKPALPKRRGIKSLTVLYAFPYRSRFIIELAWTLITQTTLQSWDKIQFSFFFHIIYRSSACKNAWASTKDLMMEIPLRFLDLISYQLFQTFDASCLGVAIIIPGKDRKKGTRKPFYYLNLVLFLSGLVPMLCCFT